VSPRPRAGRGVRADKERAAAKAINARLKEGPLTKNGPIDFAQSLTIYMKTSN
jgi:hypothetical protein